MAIIDQDGKCILEPGLFKIYVSANQPDDRSVQLTQNKVLKGSFELIGNRTEIEY